MVQCITNIVVAQWSANVLLASGAAPAMVDNPSEASPFAAAADALLINLGTPYHDTAEAMIAAVTTATANATPWVLDPVAVGPLAWRTELALTLLEVGSPAMIRGNASEILALGGGAGGKGRTGDGWPSLAFDTVTRGTRTGLLPRAHHSAQGCASIARDQVSCSSSQ
jgi:hydroxyethylthiazole kinase